MIFIELENKSSLLVYALVRFLYLNENKLNWSTFETIHLSKIQHAEKLQTQYFRAFNKLYHICTFWVKCSFWIHILITLYKLVYKCQMFWYSCTFGWFRFECVLAVGCGKPLATNDCDFLVATNCWKFSNSVCVL